MPQTSTGFTSLNDYLNANQTAAQGLGSTLADAVSNQATQAKSAADATAQDVYNRVASGEKKVDPTTGAGYADSASKLQDASAALKGLGTFGYDASQLQKLYGSSGGYSAGDRAFDANLAGAAGGPAFQAAQAKFGGLDSYLADKTGGAVTSGGAAFVAAHPTPKAPVPGQSPSFGGAPPTVTHTGGVTTVNGTPTDTPGNRKNRPDPIDRQGRGGF